MAKWYERANEASFKATAGGYVFQAPSPWMFARPRYYLVNEAQKARLLVALGRWRVDLLVAVLVNAALTVALLLLPATVYRALGPLVNKLGIVPSLLLMTALILLLIAPFVVVAQIRLKRAMAPVLADAPATQERITVREQLPRIATAVSGWLLVIGLIGGLAMLAGGAMEMIEAVMSGHAARHAFPVAMLMTMGALMSAYFVYLMRLKARQKRVAVG